eukprot:9110_1
MSTHSFFALICLPILCIQSADINLKFSIGNKVINNLPEMYAGYMTDWLTKEPWTNGSILEANLSNPDLITLTKALAPAFWRIGGTPQDNAMYNFSAMCVNGILPPPPNYGCKSKSQMNCLNISRWKQINEFALQTNSKILFGLNTCYGRQKSSTSMNFTNIEQLFEYTSTQQTGFDNIYGFEFGNEQNGHIDPDIYAKDFITAYNLLHKYKWKQMPIFIGFDSEQSTEAQTWSHDIYSNLSHMTNNNLSSIMQSFTYHNYPGCQYSNSGETVYEMSCLEKIPNLAKNFYDMSTKTYGIQTWMGEGSDHSGGGIANQTDRWIGSFYYMYQLCEVAKNGLSGTVRADLVGGNYELIDRYNFQPNPDYWILYLFKDYIGNKMYNSSFNITEETNSRGYVFSSKTNNNMYYICVLINFNLHKSVSMTINIENEDMNGYMFDIYHIEGVG